MKKRNPSIKRNFIYNIIYQLLTIITPLLVTPYVSRVLQPEGIGAYAYAYATANYFVLVTMMGLNNYGNRMAAKSRDDKNTLSQVFWSVYRMQMITSIACVSFYILMLMIFKVNSSVSWIMLLYVISAGVDITWFFQGLEEFRITVTRNAVLKIISTILIFIFVKSKSDVWIYSFIMVGAILLNQLLLWPFVPRYVTRTVFNLKEVAAHFKPNLILFIPTIAVSFYRVMDKIMLGAMSGKVEVGFYESTDKLISIPLCLVTAFGTVMLPRMSNLVAKFNSKELNGIIQKSLAVSTLISAPLITGMLVIIEDFVPFYYGIGYDKCIILFYILLPSTLFIAMANVIRTQVLLPNEMDRVYVLSCVLGAIINVIINVIFIPQYGSIGAALGTLITEIVVWGVQMWYARKYVDMKEAGKYIIMVIACSIIMGIVVFFFKTSINSIFVQLGIKVFIGAIVYVMLVYVVSRISKLKIANEILEMCMCIIRRNHKIL